MAAAVLYIAAIRYNTTPQNIKKSIEQCTRFHYMFVKDRSELLTPRYEKSGLFLGSLPLEEFRRKFMTIYEATAVDKYSRTASEGLLHAIEAFKRNTTFETKITILEDKHIEKPFESHDDLISLIKNLRKIWIGGERTSGYGLMTIKKVEESAEELTTHIEPNKNYIALSHIKLADIQKANCKIIRGDISRLFRYGIPSDTCLSLHLEPGTIFKTSSPIKIYPTFDGRNICEASP